jgi:hypothetical protein
MQNTILREGFTSYSLFQNCIAIMRWLRCEVLNNMCFGYYLSCFTTALLMLINANNLPGQVTNISGTINSYYPVTNMDVGNQMVQVVSSSGISIGDRMLLIQMQGATMNTDNLPSFGDVIDENGAGRSEVVHICSVNGNEITFEDTLVYNDYQASGKIQLVSIPQYQDANVIDFLTGNAWNGISGGVLILEVAGTLELNDFITMSGKGFRGGGFQNSGYTCSAFVEVPNYSYPNGDLGGLKGEGIADYVPTQEYGKGAQGNGGGGGNDHNSGGGGGGLRTAGGLGGENIGSGLFSCKGIHPGIGGKAQAEAGRIYMGGGGGAGHGNNSGGTSGGNGGGIIIILADTLIGNSFSIVSSGTSANDAISDAAGGGGSGGTIVLDINHFSSNTSLSVFGGNGGNTDALSQNQCFGPGGGGAGGVVISESSLPPEAMLTLFGGTAGTIFNSTGACNGSSGNATSGMSGIPEISTLAGSLDLIFCCNDTMQPSITCPENQAVASDVNCVSTIPDLTGLVSASDDCDSISITQTPFANTTFTDSIIVTMTATDVAGNTDSCSFYLISDISTPDNDLDGIKNSCDNCPMDYNPDQTDTNNNGIGDVCEPCLNIPLVLYVDSTQTSPSPDGFSWTSAFPDLQSALILACLCDSAKQIWVAAGTYYPDTGPDQTPDDQTSTFQLCNDVALYGGFPGIPGQEGDFQTRNIQLNQTVLSGDLLQNDDSNIPVDELLTNTSRSDNAFNVVIGVGVDTTTILDGFTITGGNSSGNGGGMFNSSSSMKISNILFVENASTNVGGGMYNGSSSPILRNVSFERNFTNASGGGIYNSNSNPTIIRSIFKQNVATTSGGGVYNTASDPTLINTSFIGNSSSLSGGGMFNNASAPILINCSLNGNASDISGGAMNNNNAVPKMINCTFSGNASSVGGGIYNLNNSNAIIKNSIIWNNLDNNGLGSANASMASFSSTPMITFSLIQSVTSADASGNKDGISTAANPNYPAFTMPLDPAIAPSVIGDMRPLSGSPVIHSGNDSAIPQDSFDIDMDGTTTEPIPDLDLTDRILGSAIDMGPYELINFPPVAVCMDITVSADSSCTGNADLAVIGIGSSDPDEDELTYSADPVGPYPFGVTDITLTVSDPNGESDQCAATITVVDLTPPVAVCKDVTIELTNGMVILDPFQIDNGSTDNAAGCGLTLVASPDVLNSPGVEIITLTITDNAGLSNSCTSTVTIIPDPAALLVDIQLYLEGAMNADNSGMTVALNDLLPISQPFNIPAFGYAGDEMADTILPTVTDWVLIELRDPGNPTLVIGTHAAFLHSDGKVTDVHGFEKVAFYGLPNEAPATYLISVKKQNHIGVLTGAPVSFSNQCLVVNFTNGSTSGAQSQKMLPNGKFALWAGDINDDGVIDAGDRSQGWNDRNSTGYHPSDATMDGVVDASERSLTWNNRNKTSGIPQ